MLGGRNRAVAPDLVRLGDHSSELYTLARAPRPPPPRARAARRPAPKPQEATAWQGKVDDWFAPSADAKEYARRVSVLHIDTLIDKKRKDQVAYVLDKLLASPRPPVQIAFLQGAIPLQAGPLFDKLLAFLAPADAPLLRSDHGRASPKSSAARSPGAGDGAAASSGRRWKRSGHKWLGRRIAVQVEGHAELCKATVDGWLPATESKVRAHAYGPYVAVYHARYDDAGLAAEPGLAELYEHDVEVALGLAAAAAEGGVDEATLATFAAARARPQVWSVNLGELVLAPAELGRLRDTLGHANCAVTHLFFECNNLFGAPYDSAAERSALPDVAAAARAVAAAARRDRKDGKNAWKELYRELVRGNRRKHDLYLLREGDVDQNAVVLQAVKNWFNPSGHAKNKEFLGKLKEDGAEQRILAELAARRRRRDDRAVDGGDRVVALVDGAWARGAVAPNAADAPMDGAKTRRVALDAGGAVELALAPGDFDALWRWDDAPRKGDVIEYDLAHQPGVAKGPRRPPAHLATADGYRRSVVVGACMRDHAQWRNCTYVDLATMTTKTIALFCPPLDTHPVSRAVWRLQHAAGTTGARAVVAALKRCHANVKVDRDDAAAVGQRVAFELDGVARTGVVARAGGDACIYGERDWPAPVAAPAAPKPAPRPRDARLGSLVEIYWDGDDAFYAGTVTSQSDKTGKLKIVYVDQTSEWLHLAAEPLAAGDKPAAGDGAPAGVAYREIDELPAWEPPEEEEVVEEEPEPEPEAPEAPEPEAPEASRKRGEPEADPMPGPGDEITVTLPGKTKAVAARVLGSVVDARAKSEASAPSDAGAAPAGRRVRRKPSAYDAGETSTELSRRLKEEAAKQKAATSSLVEVYDLDVAGATVSYQLREAGADDGPGLPWTLVKAFVPPPKPPKKPKAAPKPKKKPAAAKKKAPAAAKKPRAAAEPRAAAAPAPERAHLRRSAPRAKFADISSTELSRQLRDADRARKAWCDVDVDGRDGAPPRRARLRLGAAERDRGLWRPVAEAASAPVDLRPEDWEAPAALRKAGDGAARARLLAKYAGVVFRDVEADYDELRVVVDVAKAAKASPRDAAAYEAVSRLAGAGGDDAPARYALSALLDLGLVAKAPADKQTRAVFAWL